MVTTKIDRDSAIVRTFNREWPSFPDCLKKRLSTIARVYPDATETIRDKNTTATIGYLSALKDTNQLSSESVFYAVSVISNIDMLTLRTLILENSDD